MKDWKVTLVQQAKALPAGEPGVYLLFAGTLLDYVGQSDHVRERLMAGHHVYDPHVHQLIASLAAARYEERLALERYFNQKYNPPNSYIGSEKQARTFDARFLQLSAEKRRDLWVGPAFDEFDLLDFHPGDPHIKELILPAEKISLNTLQAPSVLSLPPEELLGF